MIYILDGCVYEDVDTSGEIVKTFTQIKDAEECEKLCEQNSQCELWTFTPSTWPDANKNYCYLKKDGTITKTTGLISGEKCGK